MMKHKIISILLVLLLVMVFSVSNVIAEDTVKLNPISDKIPGDSVTISGTTTFSEISVKVISPDKTILYVTTIRGGDFSKTFTLPTDATPGIYEVVAGVGQVVDTVSFEVGTAAQPKIISIDEVKVTTTVKKAPVLPAKVTVRYDNNSSKQVDVIWDNIDPALYAQVGTFTIEGVVAETDLKAKAIITVIAAGGNTGGGVIPITPPTLEEDQSEETGETKDGGQEDENETETPGSDKPEDGVVYFSDLDSVPWAKESIEALAAKGIVNGVGDGTFRPKNNVTRAEFIKMLVMAFDLLDENAVSTFSDVKPGMWYYEAIASAEKLGIVKGKGDGTFGVNEYISRQDMAVMVYRTAILLGMDLKAGSEGVQFIDKEEIASYALEAVAAMQNEGIITGTGDNKFAPRNNATRAEAAVIIYRIYNKMMQ